MKKIRIPVLMGSTSFGGWLSCTGEQHPERKPCDTGNTQSHRRRGKILSTVVTNLSLHIWLVFTVRVSRKESHLATAAGPIQDSVYRQQAHQCRGQGEGRRWPWSWSRGDVLSRARVPNAPSALCLLKLRPLCGLHLHLSLFCYQTP